MEHVTSITFDFKCHLVITIATGVGMKRKCEKFKNFYCELLQYMSASPLERRSHCWMDKYIPPYVILTEDSVSHEELALDR